MTYPLEFRKKVMELKAKHGLTYDQNAKHFFIGKDTLKRWCKSLEPKTHEN